MVEMVTEGRSGFIAKSGSPPDLAEALRRALATPPEVLATMGGAAAEDIRRLCDPRRIVELHLDFRSRIAKRGASASTRLPCESRGRVQALSNDGAGIAIVVTGERPDRGLESSLASIAAQSLSPAAVVIALGEAGRDRPLQELDEMRALSPRVLENAGTGASAKIRAVESVLGSGPRPLGFAFVDAGERIAPELVAIGEKILRKAPGVGVVSFWSWEPEGDRLWVPLSPRFPQQWLSNEASPMSVLRTEALVAAGGFRAEVAPGLELWDLVNAILVSGWAAVTVPEPLGALARSARETPWVLLGEERRRERNVLLTRFPESVSRHASEIVALAQSVAFRVKEIEHARWRNRWTPRGLARRVRNRWTLMVSGRLPRDSK
jgi:hypothetical protein